MKVLCALVTFFGLIFCGFDCQIHYVPAQLLIPTFNGTYIIANQSISNNYSNYVPIIYNPTYNNSQKNNNSVAYNVTGNTGYGHVSLGAIQPFDRLLFNQEYFKDGRWWTTREKIIEYPKDLPAGYSRHETISALRIINKFYDGYTARATVEEGGIGKQYVKIKLRSQRGKGFRYLLQIFGH